MTAMRPPHANAHGRAYAAYFCLFLLFAISVSSQARVIAKALAILLHSSEHVREPFGINGAEMGVIHPQPEAAAAGIRTGEDLVGVNGHQASGVADFYSVILDGRPGQILQVRVRPTTPASAARDVSLKLQPAFPAGTQISDWLKFTIATVAIPALCFGLGYWVAFVRIRDKLAWLLLVVFLSFAEVFSYISVGTAGFFGLEGSLQPFFAAYHVLVANLFSSALLLFVLYFPEQLRFDRRFPWAKWLVVGPLVFQVISSSVLIFLFEHHAAAAREFLAVLGSVMGTLSLLHFVVVILFFVVLGYKTFIAADRDARRRLLLLDTASAISVIPLILWLLLNKRFVVPDWMMMAMAALWFVFPLTMAYVILVYRAMDVRLVIRQGLRYLLAKNGIRAVQVIVSAGIIIVAASVSGGPNGGVARRVVPICAGFAVIALIGTSAGRVQQWLDRRFFREAYHAEQILSELAEQVRRIVDTNLVLETVTHQISHSLHVPRIAMLLNNGGTFELAYGVGYSAFDGVRIPENSVTVEKLRKNQQLAVHFDGAESWIRQAGETERNSIEKLQPELLLPLSLSDNLVGIMSLGPKQSEEPFTRTDIQLLDSVATQTGLALENSRLSEKIAAELAERERLNRELEIAREVQQRLFPQKTPSISGIEIAGYCRPALGVGGDYYDYFALDDGSLGIAIGDVSGKGFPAALLMASLRASLRAQTMRGDCNLAQIIQNVNVLAYESSAINKFATFFYAQYSPASRLLSYVNAGHEPPLVFRGDSVIRLDAGGPVVGLLPAIQYDQGTLTLQPGDILVALTDGISEAMNVSDEEWGVKNLISCVRNCNGGASSEVIDRIIASADAFCAGAKQHDDMTLVVAQILCC